MKYIQSTQAQEITDKIHYTNMVNQYHSFIGQPDSKGVIITAERIQEYWSADKPFLDCSQSEAIDQYSLVGFNPKTGVPLVDPLDGITNKWSTVFTAKKYEYPEDGDPIVIEEYPNCISCPDNIDDYDLSEFTYNVVDIDNG